MKQNQFLAEKTFIFADGHHSHTNYVRGTSKWTDKSKCRDFDTVEEMNACLIKSINDTVPEDATLFHLGDWSFGKKENVKIFRDQVNCKDVHFMYGNHDFSVLKDPSLQKLFTRCDHYREIYSKGQMFVLFHYALRVFNQGHHGAINLYAHSHGTLPPIGRSLDVGWDVFHRPLSLDEIVDMLKDVPPLLVDHHTEETH